MKWLLIAIILNAQTGKPLKVEVIKPFDDPVACLSALADTGPKLVQDGNMKMYRCRAFDENGVPVPELKVDAEGSPIDDKAAAARGTSVTI